MRHVFFLLAIFQCMLFACSNNSKPTAAAPLLKDSLIQNYFRWIDSSEFDTSEHSYRMLKAYALNDTGFLKEQNRIINLSRKSMQDWNCIHQQALGNLNADEAYRFAYSAAFCPYELNVTVIYKDNNTTLHFILYQNDTTPPCRLVSEYDKPLTQKNWEDIKAAIKNADFWGLKSSNDNRGLDGRTLIVTGFTMGRHTFEGTPKRNYVYRWGNTALYDPFELMLKLSGNTKGCLVIK